MRLTTSTLMLTLFMAPLLPAASSSATLQPAGISGAWRLNPELSSPVPDGPGGDRERPRRPGGGNGAPGGRGGGMGGRGGRGGGPGGPGGLTGGGGRVNEKDLRRLQVIRQRLAEPAARLVVVRDAERAVITDGEGRSLAYKTDGKKEDRLTGDGEYTTKAVMEGEALVVEEDFGGKVTLVTRYAMVVSEERERLEVTIRARGLPRMADRPGGRGMPPRDGGDPAAQRPGRPDSVTRVYERDTPQR